MSDLSWKFHDNPFIVISNKQTYMKTYPSPFDEGKNHDKDKNDNDNNINDEINDNNDCNKNSNDLFSQILILMHILHVWKTDSNIHANMIYKCNSRNGCQTIIW